MDAPQRRLRRLIRPAAITAMALLAGCGGDGSDGGDERTPADYEVKALDPADLETCQPRPDPSYGFLCGEIEVPFERADSSYGTTRIGFAYRPRDDRAKPSLGPIFAVEGGPGYSSIGTAITYHDLFGSLLRRHELVLVDLRGVGHSGPIDCPDIQRARGPEWITVGDCAERLGKRFESYRTAAAADDIDDVRKALGYDRIALYGDSYGTFLGQSYAFRHGENLDALVLDSAYPAYGEDPWYPSLIRTGNRAIREVCDRAPDCDGDALARLERAAEKLRKQRISVGPLIDAVAEGAYGPPDSYLEADEGVRALLRGDQEAYDDLTLYQTEGSTRKIKYTAAGEFVFGCNDYPMIWDKEATEAERRAQLERAIEEYPKDAFGPFKPREVALSATVGYLECITWPAPTELYEPAVDPETDEPTQAPVLVVSGEFDDLTTPWEGKQVAKLFPDSEYYEARNAGHVDALYYTNGAAAREIRAFLREHVGG
jgi:pimeloyl-ACP methyl ester carboxylesterase